MSEEQINLEEKNLRQNMYFASNSVSSVTINKNTIPKKYSIDSIMKALEKPSTNYKLLQETSLYLYNVSGVYNRWIDHFANMPTYDCMLKPNPMTFGKNNKNALKNYYESAMLIERMNVKYNFKWMAKKLYLLGELYIYKVQDNKNGAVIYKEIPNQICRISGVTDNICLYSIDLSSLSDKNLLATMPQEIQKIYEKFQAKSIKSEDLIDGKWYELKENAFAFNLIDPFTPKGHPKLSYLFTGLISLEETNNEQLDNSKADNFKLVSQEAPIDDEGNSIIDPLVLEKYHYSTKSNMPKNLATVTSPLKISVHTLQNKAQNSSAREDMVNMVYASAGVNQEIFSGKKSSNEGIAMSIKTDEMYSLSIIKLFENYVNYELRQNKKTSYWLCKFLETTFFNKDEYKRQCETSLSFSGNGNQLNYLSSCSYSPLEAMTLLQYEKDLGIEDLFKPAMNSYNSSGKAISDNGRPDKKDSEDDSSSSTTAEAE